MARLSTIHSQRATAPKTGTRTSEFWLIAALSLAAIALVLLGWKAQSILRILFAPATLAAVYAALRTWLKRETIKLLTEIPNMTTGNTITQAFADPAKYVDTVLENIVKSKLPAFAAYQPQVDAVIEAGVALGWAVLEKAVLAKLVVKYPQLGTALTAAGVTL
jgi:hypothetical protein